MTTLAFKYTTESELINFNFTPVLLTGETISSAALSVTVRTGTDATPSAILSGSASISGGYVVQRVIAGTDNVTYRITCTATTSSSNIYTLTADLPVYSPTNSGV